MLTVKKDFYVSFNQDELAVLNELSLEELGLYFLLKQFGNFQTGIVGKFRQQKLSYAELGRRLSRPASQGKAARTFDASQVIRLLERLEAVQLVRDRDIESATGRLVMRLPMSPIGWRKKETEVAMRPDAEAGKLPRHADVQMAQTPYAAKVSACSPSLQSVMVSRRETSILFSDTHGAKPRVEPLKEPDAEGPLTVAAIEAEVAAAGAQFSSTPISRTYYGHWAKRGLPRFDLDSALLLFKTSGALFTPKDVHDHLFPNRSRPRTNAATACGAVL